MPCGEWTTTEETRCGRNSRMIGNSRIPDVTVARLHSENGGVCERGTPLKMNDLETGGDPAGRQHITKTITEKELSTIGNMFPDKRSTRCAICQTATGGYSPKPTE